MRSVIASLDNHSPKRCIDTAYDVAGVGNVSEFAVYTVPEIPDIGIGGTEKNRNLCCIGIRFGCTAIGVSRTIPRPSDL